MYVHTWVHMYVRIYVHTNIPTYVPMHIRTFMYSSLQSKIIRNLNNFTTLSHNYSYFCLCVLGFRAVLILRGWPKYVIISKFCADSYGGCITSRQERKATIKSEEWVNCELRIYVRLSVL